MLTSISLFSGAGGLDLGLENEGFETRAFVEIDRYTASTLQENQRFWRRGHVPVLGDITELSPFAVMDAAGMTPGKTTVVAGGPPCQSFSTAGRRGAISDPRGSLVIHFARMVHSIQPRFFVFENVRGILSAAIKHRPLRLRGKATPPLTQEEELGSALRRIVLPLLREQLGYEVVYGLINAADYGVPQTRQRVIFFGSRDREFNSDRWPFLEMALPRLMPPTHSRHGEEGLPTWRTLRDAVSGLVEREPEYLPYSQARKEVLDLVPSGRNWRYIRDNHGDATLRKIMGGAYAADGGKVGFWRRLDYDKPCPTVPTSPIQKGTSLCHPEVTRPLSVREYSRVQQFPDEYQFFGSTASKYKQIGNAVPVGLGSAIGGTILGVLRGHRRVAEERVAYSATRG